MSLDHDSLWKKAQLFIDRGLEKRDEARFDEFQLWAALMLEVLGKAALSKIHPAMIVDPQNFESLYIACGGPGSPDEVRTIPAKTLFERCRHVFKSFDQTDQTFCMLMANRRNGELHSGATPFQAIALEHWQPKFWRVTKVLLQAQGKTLVDCVGPQEAAATEEILKDASTALLAAISGRIRKHAAAFALNYPGNMADEARKHSKISANSRIGDRRVCEMCPACKCEGILTGEDFDHEYGDFQGSEDGYLREVLTRYSTDGFQCFVCGLSIEGQDEIAAADLPVEYTTTTYEEADYDDEYNNE